MRVTKYAVFLVNNKRGGVDTFLEQLCRDTEVELLVNKGHFKNIDLKKIGEGSKVSAFSELADIIIFFFPFVERKNAERISYLLDILTFGVFGFVYNTVNSFWNLTKMEGSKPLLVLMGGYPGALQGRIFAWIASSFKKRKVVMSIHNLRGESSRWTKLRDALIDRWLLQKVKSWIFVSQVTLDSMNGFNFGRANRYVVYNGISDFETSSHLEKKAGLSDKNFLDIGLVGTFEKRKGFDLAISAYSKVRPSEQIGRLKIFGEGSKTETAALYDLIKDLDLENDVDLVGFVEDKSKIYEAVDIIIVPSLAFESFGYVALESIQRNVPVIVSDHGGLKEVSEIIGNPNIFKSGDVEALEKTLISVTKNYHENVANLSVMRSEIKANFSQERMVQEYEAIILNENL